MGGRASWGCLGLLTALLLTACSTDFVSPEDERCTIYVGVGEPASINRWQIDNCESVRVIVVRFGGAVLYSYERSVP